MTIVNQPLDTVFFDMGNTLLDFHTGRTDDEKDEAGLRALTRHTGRIKT